jgi:hypothetical protein
MVVIPSRDRGDLVQPSRIGLAAAANLGSNALDATTAAEGRACDEIDI